MKRLFAVLAAAALLAVCFGCTKDPGGETPGGTGGSQGGSDPPAGHVLSPLRAVGTDVLDKDGKRVMLRGVNAGGLGVIETWMTGFIADEAAPDDGSKGGDIRVRDHYTISKVWGERFGYDTAKDLWADYRASWWSDEDFQNCRDMGINVIRLPFTYMNVDFDAVQGLEHAGKTYDFTFLDEFVSRAEECGIYTILDMHGAYGSQNGQDHSGQTFDSVEEVDFFENEEKIALTEKLWKAIAAHFKDNPAVAGYDLLNEPLEKAEGATTEKHWAVFDRLYDAIRTEDTGHIVIFESCWDENALPMPAMWGWENCMYSFHHYTGTGGTEDALYTDMAKRVMGLVRAGFGVPIQMGEFTCYRFEGFWKKTLKLFNDNNVHWTSWTYKVGISSPWGVFDVKLDPAQRVAAHTDSVETIRAKFRLVETQNATLYTFESGKPLYEIIQEFAQEEYRTTPTGEVAG